MSNLIAFIILAVFIVVELQIIHYYSKPQTPGKPFLDIQVDPYFKQYMQISNSIDYVSNQEEAVRLLRDINSFQLRHTNNGNHSSFEVDVDTSKLISRLEIQQILLQQQGIYLQLQF